MNYFKFCLLFIFVQLSHQLKRKLPDTARPHHYEIKIFPSLMMEAKNFIGESKIFLQVFTPDKTLTFHSVNLRIFENATKLTGNNKNLIPQNHIYDSESQFVTLNFKEFIQPGNYILNLKFVGAIEDGWNPNNSGFFRKKYKNKLLVSTYFNSLQARKIFPCWDELSIKTTFSIGIKRSKNHNAVSNMPEQETVTDPNNHDYVWTYFKKTPLMSPNMVCIIVMDVHHMTANKENTFLIDFDLESSETAFHTLKRAMNAMELLEKYIGIKSEFPVTQLIGVLDQNEEPMGKCGVIVTSLLIQPSADYLEDDREVKPYVHIIYELARQWFKCIITPATPEDNWITEGLVFYISHSILSKMDSFSVFVEFTRYRYSFYALNADVNVYNGPTIQDGTLMNYDIESEALMHMISGVLTENIFHYIINAIVQTYKYKTISTDQFWNTVQEEMEKLQIPRNNFNIRQYLEPYILQNGHPIVNVERDYSCNTIKLKQTSSMAPKGFPDKKWWIPINIVGSHTRNFSSTSVNNWMNPHDEKLIADGLTHDDWWYIVNVQSFGLYRVNYDERNWNRLVDCLNSDDFRNIHVLNRMRIVDDALYFKQENKLPQNVIGGIEKYIRSKKDIVSATRARDLLDLYD